MKICILITTSGRKSLLLQSLAHLETQRRLPDEIIISAPDASHVPDYHSGKIKLSHVFGTPGLTAQRNRALDLIESNA